MNRFICECVFCSIRCCCCCSVMYNAHNAWHQKLKRKKKLKNAFDFDVVTFIVLLCVVSCTRDGAIFALCFVYVCACRTSFFFSVKWSFVLCSMEWQWLFFYHSFPRKKLKTTTTTTTTRRLQYRTKDKNCVRGTKNLSWCDKTKATAKQKQKRDWKRWREFQWTFLNMKWYEN